MDCRWVVWRERSWVRILAGRLVDGSAGSSAEMRGFSTAVLRAECWAALKAVMTVC